MTNRSADLPPFVSPGVALASGRVAEGRSSRHGGPGAREEARTEGTREHRNASVEGPTLDTARVSTILARMQQMAHELAATRRALDETRSMLLASRANERSAWREARHDPLTDLPNRACFHERIAQVLGRLDAASEPRALLYLDLDDFKPINDCHGHDVGDRLLQIVAIRLVRAVRTSDVVGRLGGDEFACLLADRFDRQQLRHMACKLFDTVSAPFRVGSTMLSVRPSIGLALWPTDGRSTADLLRHADAAMYRAKRSQSGYAFYEAASAGGDRALPGPCAGV